MLGESCLPGFCRQTWQGGRPVRCQRPVPATAGDIAWYSRLQRSQSRAASGATFAAGELSPAAAGASLSGWGALQKGTAHCPPCWPARSQHLWAQQRIWYCHAGGIPGDLAVQGLLADPESLVQGARSRSSDFYPALVQALGPKVQWRQCHGCKVSLQCSFHDGQVDSH